MLCCVHNTGIVPVLHSASILLQYLYISNSRRKYIRGKCHGAFNDGSTPTNAGYRAGGRWNYSQCCTSYIIYYELSHFKTQQKIEIANSMPNPNGAFWMFGKILRNRHNTYKPASASSKTHPSKMRCARGTSRCYTYFIVARVPL
jgi:hypothetical protein